MPYLGKQKHSSEFLGNVKQRNRREFQQQKSGNHNKSIMSDIEADEVKTRQKTICSAFIKTFKERGK